MSQILLSFLPRWFRNQAQPAPIHGAVHGLAEWLSRNCEGPTSKFEVGLQTYDLKLLKTRAREEIQCRTEIGPVVSTPYTKPNTNSDLELQTNTTLNFTFLYISPCWDSLIAHNKGLPSAMALSPLGASDSMQGEAAIFHLVEGPQMFADDPKDLSVTWSAGCYLDTCSGGDASCEARLCSRSCSLCLSWGEFLVLVRGSGARPPPSAARALSQNWQETIGSSARFSVVRTRKKNLLRGCCSQPHGSGKLCVEHRRALDSGDSTATADVRAHRTRRLLHSSDVHAFDCSWLAQRRERVRAKRSRRETTYLYNLMEFCRSTCRQRMPTTQPDWYACRCCCAVTSLKTSERSLWANGTAFGRAFHARGWWSYDHDCKEQGIEECGRRWACMRTQAPARSIVTSSLQGRVRRSATPCCWPLGPATESSQVWTLSMLPWHHGFCISLLQFTCGYLASWNVHPKSNYCGAEWGQASSYHRVHGAWRWGAMTSVLLMQSRIVRADLTPTLTFRIVWSGGNICSWAVTFSFEKIFARREHMEKSERDGHVAPLGTLWVFDWFRESVITLRTFFLY